MRLWINKKVPMNIDTFKGQFVKHTLSVELPIGLECHYNFGALDH